MVKEGRENSTGADPKAQGKHRTKCKLDQPSPVLYPQREYRVDQEKIKAYNKKESRYRCNHSSQHHSGAEQANLK